MTTYGPYGRPNNMTFAFNCWYVPREESWHNRSDCDICEQQDKQLAALRVHVISRAFFSIRRCCE